MRIKLLSTTVSAVFLALVLTGCTIFSWGGPAQTKAAPEPQAGDIFKQAEELLGKGKYEEARKAYTRVKEQDPEKSYEPLVQIRLGDSYYEEERYSEAEVEYRRFLELHPHNKAAPYAKYQTGMCNFKQMGKADRDPSFASSAMKEFSELLRDYPNNPYVEEAQERLKIAKSRVAENEYVVGWYYYKRDNYKAAVKRFKGIIENFPGCKDEPETLYYLADSYIELGEYDNAKNTLAILYKEHPNHRMAIKAQKKLAGKIPVK